jgi:N-acetyl-gamma-glutamyl-phosphate reductase
MIRVSILGASGYVGGELMRLIAGHPDMEVAVAFGATAAGRAVSALHPHLALAYPDLGFATWDKTLLKGSDLILAALPHGDTQRLADDILAPGVPVVDLGADFRLDSVADYQRWYGEPHARPELIDSFTYGLPEFFRAAIKGSKRVAAPVRGRIFARSRAICALTGCSTTAIPPRWKWCRARKCCSPRTSSR